MLEVKDLRVKIEDNNVIDGLDLSIGEGETHVIMGPNGSGKSTLSLALMGHPSYDINGSIKFNDKDITKLSADKRAKEGLFLAFQYPREIEGVTVSSFLKTAYEKLHGHIGIVDFMDILKGKMTDLKIEPSFKDRYLNQGFSGGEKKRMEMLQLSVLDPKLAILDEIDSGLDRDALEIVGRSIESMKDGKRSFLIITHYSRILDFVKADHIHIMKSGKIVESGGKDIIEEIEAKGYEGY